MHPGHPPLDPARRWRQRDRMSTPSPETDPPPPPPPVGRLKHMQAWLAWIPRYERQLSAVGMIAGFVTDNLMFRRIDLPNTQYIFIAYLAAAAISILILHIINAHSDPEKPRPRWQTWLPFASQFALGG